MKLYELIITEYEFPEIKYQKAAQTVPDFYDYEDNAFYTDDDFRTDNQKNIKEPPNYWHFYKPPHNFFSREDFLYLLCYYMSIHTHTAWKSSISF